MRLFSFINFYLSSIAQGIQTAHVQQELVNKYVDQFNWKPFTGDHSPQEQALIKWATLHKTIVVLNGGAAGDIRSKDGWFQKFAAEMEQQIKPFDDVGLPWASFSEDEHSLDGSMTAVGIVLPECIYDAVNYKTAMNSVTDPRSFSKVYDINEREGTWFYLRPKNDQDPTPASWLTSYHPEVAAHYPPGSPVALFLGWMKSCPLAR